MARKLDLIDEIDFVRKTFDGQRDLTHRHKWHHGVDVMIKLTTFSDLDKVKMPLQDIRLAALGHDLLEDTKITVEELEKRWGKQAVKWVVGMSKKMHDFDNQAPYLEQLANSDEEVWLIKLADIVSNASNSHHWLKELDPKWRDTFWFPLLRDYRVWYRNLKWQKYPKAGAALIAKCDEWIEKLVDAK